MTGYYDRDFVYIRGRPIRHSTARRDWVCGTCGGRLTTRYTLGESAADSGWRTECFDHPRHDPDGFMHKGSWAYVEARRAMERVRAREVFAHLPKELQAAILEAALAMSNERRESCPSRD